MSTCPPVPSFSGIRVGPSTGKRAMPARRPMPKSRQASTSGASATAKTPTTPKEDALKLNLSLSLPHASYPQRDDGPEEGEVSDEDDHYSPREATTPVHVVPLANPLERTIIVNLPAPPPLPPPFLNTMNNNKPNADLTRKEQLNLNASQNNQDPQTMTIQELRENAQKAVMYLACSANLSFDDIVSEGVDRGLLGRLFDRLKLPVQPSSEPRDPSKNGIAPTPIPPTIPTSEMTNGFKPTLPAANIQITPITNSVTITDNLPTSLPPKPPSVAPIPLSLTPKPESVVSRFNQLIPGLNLVPSPSGSVSPPAPTPLSDLNGQDTTSNSQGGSVSTTASLRTRKRPVAADFDTEIKTTFFYPKQPRFGNRQSLETSQLIFDVSDNEDEGPRSLRVATHPSDLSRPDSTNPENNEKLGESLRQKEIEIELMRQKIMAMSRKKKMAANGEIGSGTPSKTSTPLPLPLSDDLISAKDSKLDQVEEFLHQTLDQLEAGNAQPGVVDAAMDLATAELMNEENATAELEVQKSTDLASSDNLPIKDTNSESMDFSDISQSSNGTPVVYLSEPKSEEPKRPSSSENSFETAPINLDTVANDEADDGYGSPMDLSDLETTTSPSNSDSEDTSGSSSSSEGISICTTIPKSPGFKFTRLMSYSDSDSDGTSSDAASVDDSEEDVEMRDSSEGGTDSVSSPIQETPDSDSYDPESHKSDIGEVTLLPGNAEIGQSQLLSIVEIQPSQAITTTTTSRRPPQKEDEFTPYRSSLSGFKSFRYHPSFNAFVSQGFKSLTYSNHIDSELPVCDFETRGGTCNDPQCRWQHFRQMALPGASTHVCEEPAAMPQIRLARSN
ncbi:hypothetical protein ABW20_dc0109806 [Dactylellina cionopaga]|nr:hypothetical protein ABW20_dc0109806 [Dactylellina cionopaga]